MIESALRHPALYPPVADAPVAVSTSHRNCFIGASIAESKNYCNQDCKTGRTKYFLIS